MTSLGVSELQELLEMLLESLSSTIVASNVPAASNVPLDVCFQLL
jgi:hypothetical protein